MPNPSSTSPTMSSPPTTFLIAGGTGRQGGAVVQALLNDTPTPVAARNIFVLTRNTSSPAALALAKQGLNLVSGSLGSPSAIFTHLASAGIDLARTAVFLAQAHGPSELSDGKAFVAAAVAARVQHLVYSSVDRGGTALSDVDPTACRTFADKFLIERHLMLETGREGVTTGYTILRPVWFLENAEWGFAGKLCMAGWRDVLGGKRMQVVTARDLGRWGVEALRRPERWGLVGGRLSVASDAVSFAELDAVYREEKGRGVAVTYGLVVRLCCWLVEDVRTMFGAIAEREYGADLGWLGERLKPMGVTEWVRQNVKQ